jgi:hypothetical protein
MDYWNSVLGQFLQKLVQQPRYPLAFFGGLSVLPISYLVLSDGLNNLACIVLELYLSNFYPLVVGM